MLLNISSTSLDLFTTKKLGRCKSDFQQISVTETQFCRRVVRLRDSQSENEFAEIKLGGVQPEQRLQPYFLLAALIPPTDKYFDKQTAMRRLPLSVKKRNLIWAELSSNILYYPFSLVLCIMFKWLKLNKFKILFRLIFKVCWFCLLRSLHFSVLLPQYKYNAKIKPPLGHQIKDSNSPQDKFSYQPSMDSIFLLMVRTALFPE